MGLLCPVLSAGPLKPIKPIKLLPHGKFPMQGYYRNQFRVPDLSALQRNIYKSYEKPSAVPLTKAFKALDDSYRPTPTIVPTAQGEWHEVPVEDGLPEETTSVIRLIRLTPPQTIKFLSLKEINENPEEMEIWELDPGDGLDVHTRQTVSNYMFERDVLKDTQEFMLENPFETRLMDDAYLEGDAIFSVLPEEPLPLEFEHLSLEERVNMELNMQQEFYFDELPYSSILLARGYIRRGYLQGAIRYYVLILIHNRPLHQKIRALTMLGFLGKKGDGEAELILNALKHDFVDPPWTVDYAAGMALLNLGEVEKFEQLVQWRLGIEARKSTRTPGISWLYGKVFGEYDMYVQELGDGMPYMRPDSVEEMEAAARHLQYIRQYATSEPEKIMWKLHNVEDMTNFLNLRGLVLRSDPTGEAQPPAPDTPTPDDK